MKDSILNGVIAGLIAGIILGLLTLTIITPLILKAERFENSVTVIKEEGASHEHGEGGEMPFYKRLLLTMIGTTTLGVSYGIVLSIVYLYLRNKGIKKGLILGFFGFLFINLLPGLGLPPNPPGVEAIAEVENRQLWWLLLISAEIMGIGIFWFIHRTLRNSYKAVAAPAAALISLAVISIPFILGSPSGIKYSLVPDDIITIFRIVSFAVAFVFWLSLGGFVAYFNKNLLKEGY
ncbi:MAG: CbtA family protein [Nitrospirae bacterium]|nr:CbtA family protein [Nitrospirota bacterium]